ncbi:RNA polymerase I transcription factor UAF [Handroanthus impetiginosus]|uniref:RNA polymerase I transcription factor UAF n=1 Tax=Handroanthus impetiginosus TaxID=429701 RepID=A0A2G9GQV9_9LAMI|nr:RNA polymerase I transcription factor UAF [Handroanthus impetiginosus]
MEEEKSEIVRTESEEKCQSIPESAEASVSVDGGRDETVSLVDKLVSAEGGEEGVSENHEAAVESESMTAAGAEKTEPPVVVAEEVVAEEGGNEVIAAESEDPPLDIKAEEEAKRADDVNGEGVVTGTGDAQSFAEPQVDTTSRGDESLVEPNPERKAEEEPAAAHDAELGTNLANSDSQIDVRGDEMPEDVQLDQKTDKELLSVDPKVEVVFANVTDAQKLSELEARGNELQATDGMEEACSYISGREIGDGQNVEAAGGVDNELLDGLTVENNAENVVEGDEVVEEKVDAVVNDSEVGMAEKPAGNEEEKVDSLISEEIPITDVTKDAEITTEVHACEVNDGEEKQVHESIGGVEYVSGDVSFEHADEKELAAEETLMSGTNTKDENMSMEVLKDSKLDEPLKVAENKEDELENEELPATDIKTETEAGVEMEEKSVDAGVETGMGTEVVAEKIPEEDSKMETEETMSDVDEAAQDDYDSPGALQDEEDEAMVAEDETGTQDTEMETETDVAESGKTSGGKRKRGKLSKSQSISKATAKGSRKTVGEDVCFICFDGGELVLCDRRGCPKAYHPSCVNRDEAFFKSKGRWNCGKCLSIFIRDRQDGRILRNVLTGHNCCYFHLNQFPTSKFFTQVDFDDRSSWEYLFKDYYIELKAKLSLSSDEIREAKNPWKGAEMSGPSKQESSEAHADANDGGSGSDDSIENLQTIRPKRRKVRKQSKSHTKEEETVSSAVEAGDKAISLSDNSEWASKELLEFVSHMKNGDTSILSQFDVQALLLEYIKRNKLRDPRRKSQIICDARLENLFGKPRVGHFEMLKLLESHFLVRDEQNDDVQGSVVDTENNQLDIDGNADPQTKGAKDRKRKSRKKDSRGPQSNLDDYAAIDMHNIGLIYLRRKLMEDLLEDAETFQDKVVGTFVRIRISGSTQKQDLYRLVQVVGTSKAPEPYKIGKKTTDIMVEILNLDKTEIIPIDTISNQEFTEEECKRLRQSIKCGLISRLTVGEILDKTMEIQTARVNDWLESEIMRLSHLRDRASDLGRRKELRECVEKLQLLKTPEERRRRLEEIPEIHADPKMDPSYESDDNDSETEDNRREREKDRHETHSLEKLNAPANISESAERALRSVSRSESFSGITSSVTSQASVSAGVVETTVKINESEKIWHYKDPSGKVQGPFSMVQLRKWNNTGYFPADLRIWRATEKPDNSILLSDALVGKFPKELPPADNMLATNLLHSSHSGKTYETSSHQDKERSNTEQSPMLLPKLLTEKWLGNDTTSLPSPTPKQSNTGLTRGEGGQTGAIQSPSVNGVVPSPTAVLPNIGTHSAVSAPVFNSVVPTTAFSPTPSSPQGILVGSASSLLTQSTTISEPHQVQTHSHLAAAVQPVQPIQPVMSQNPQADTQSWGNGGQPTQPHSYGWGAPNVQHPSGNMSNSGQPAGPQHDVWRPTQASQPNMHQPPATPNASWAMAPVDNNNASMGMRPENPNIGWGAMLPNTNMGWVNPAPGNTNMNWAPTMQGPPVGNATPGWVASPVNTGANIQGMVPGPGNATPNIQGMVPGPGNGNPSWAPPQAWGAPPVQGPVPGNGWGPPPGGNPGAPPPVQGPLQGNTPNQGWGAPPPGNQGPWSGEQNQFSGQRGPQGRDSGFNGGRPWNRQSSFGGGGSRPNKRDTICPYNANGRCKKGARCDYLHT